MKYTVRYFRSGMPDHHIKTITLMAANTDSARREGDKIMRSHRFDLDGLSASVQPA